MLCQRITSSRSLGMRFLLGGIYALETFLTISSIFLNLGFWGKSKEGLSEIIRSAMVIVRQVSLEVINSWELPSIPKTSEQFKKLLELLSVFIFYAELKPDISNELMLFDKVILWELQCMVDLMSAYDLLSKVEIDAFIFSK